jgi:hypothetical protein
VAIIFSLYKGLQSLNLFALGLVLNLVGVS